MQTQTEEQTLKIEDKKKYIQEKEKHLKRYKALADELDYAVDDVEAGFIKEKRAKLATKIKTFSKLLREIESMETMA